MPYRLVNGVLFNVAWLGIVMSQSALYRSRAGRGVAVALALCLDGLKG